MIDTLAAVETPEGVDMTLRLAGPGPRLLAWLLDLAVRSIIIVIAAIPLGMMGQAGQGLILITIFALEWFYPVVWELTYKGQTPGKVALGLRVVRDDGTPLDLASSVLRNLLRAADFLPFLNVAALVSMVSNRHFKRLGDLAAGTVVVYDRPARERRPPRRADPIPPPFPLSLDEQRALMAFARRVGTLSADRGHELAGLAEPLWRAYPQRDRVETLLGIAAWLEGARPSQSMGRVG